jgi:protein lifeguard
MPSYNFQPSPVSGPYIQYDPTKDMSSASTLSVDSRIAFIRKVYHILITQLSITAIGVFISVHVPGFREFFKANLGIYFFAVVIFVTLLLVLGCCKSVSRKVPINYILLFIFTLSMTYMA